MLERELLHGYLNELPRRSLSEDEHRLDMGHWPRHVPTLVTLSNADDIFIQEAALKLRNCIRQRLTTNPIPGLRGLFATSRQGVTVYETTEEVVVAKPDTRVTQTPVIPGVMQRESVSEAIIPVAPIVAESVQVVEGESETPEAERFSVQEVGALSLLIGSLNGSSIGIDENTVFEFRADKEVVDICNRWVWSLPFEHADTIKLYAKDYLTLRKGALEKVRDILMLDEAEILEIASRQNHEDIENLLVGLAIGDTRLRQRTAWFFDQILQRPEDIAWNDETGYITQLWRKANIGSVDPGSSMVDVIENTLQTDEYLEIIPVDYSKAPVEIPNGHEVRIVTLERRDSQVRGKVRGYIEQVRSLSRMPSLVDGGQLSQYFKPALRAGDIGGLLKDGFITPALSRNNIPYYDMDDIVVLLYMRNKPQRIDMTGLQKELKKIVQDELENLDSKT